MSEQSLEPQSPTSELGGNGFFVFVSVVLLIQVGRAAGAGQEGSRMD